MLFSSRSNRGARDWPADVEPSPSLQPFIVWQGRDLYISEEVYERDPFLATYTSRLKEAGYDFKSYWLKIQKFAEVRQKVNAGAEADKTYIESEIIGYLSKAIEQRASDVHIEIYKNHATIAFRVDGLLRVVQELRVEVAKGIVSVLYGTWCDVGEGTYAEHTFQSSRVSDEKVPDGLHGIRIERGPHHQGQFMVLRLLWYNDQGQKSLQDQLQIRGFSESNISTIRAVCERPEGLNISAGPTGSGKSTTIRDILESIFAVRPEQQVTTIEDPPEAPIRGARQLPVVDNDAISRDNAFEERIKTAMRADPDILMVGEIRGPRTAALAIEASLTGHLVYTTIHASSTFGILTRLARLLAKHDKDTPSNVLRDICDHTLISSLAFQRLCPVLCDSCKLSLLDKPQMLSPGRILGILAAYNPNESQALLEQFKSGRAIESMMSEHEESLKGVCVTDPKGCEKCSGTGIHGRVVLAEVIATDVQLFNWVKEKGVDFARQRWIADRARHGSSGGQTIQAHAREKVKTGFIDPYHAELRIGRLMVDQRLEDDRFDNWEVELMGIV